MQHFSSWIEEPQDALDGSNGDAAGGDLERICVLLQLETVVELNEQRTQTTNKRRKMRLMRTRRTRKKKKK